MTDRTRHFQDVSRLSQAALRANDTAKEVIYNMTGTPTPDLTAQEAVERPCKAAPFADNDAGIPEMVATLRALAAKLAEAEAERAAARGENARLRGALTEIRDSPCMDPDGNSEIARAALNKGEV